ncbi:MAG: HAD family hydrolase [Planctomycetes bacterium]|nr:HAD family hydrolase [Planctomycetota bacterium]
MPACLVALDLDGTLLTADSRIPAGHERAVDDMRRLGAEVVLVTGRSLMTTGWVWRMLRLRTPVICFNGAWAGLPGSVPTCSAVLDEDSVNAIVSELRPFAGAICAYPDESTWIMDREIPRTRHWREHYGARIDVLPQRFSPWRGPSYKVMFVTDPDLLPGVCAHVRDRLGDRLHIVASESDRVEILPRGITKAWALERVARDLGIGRERVWAVGDADNDREMIRWAGHGCAMGHAHDALRDQARHVLPSIHARGLCALPGMIARAYGRSAPADG